MNKITNEKIFEGWKVFNKELFQNNNLKNIFVEKLDELHDNDIELNELDRQAWINNVILSGVAVTDNQNIYIDAYVGKIIFEIGFYRGGVTADFEIKIFSPKDKRKYNFVYNIEDIISPNIWFSFEYSDSFDIFCEKRNETIDHINKLNNYLTEYFGSNVINFDVDLEQMETNHKYETLKSVKEKFMKSETYNESDYTEEEKKLVSFFNPLSTKINLNLENTGDLNSDEYLKIKEEVCMFLEDLISEDKKDFSLIEKYPYLRGLKLKLTINKTEGTESRKRPKI